MKYFLIAAAFQLIIKSCYLQNSDFNDKSSYLAKFVDALTLAELDSSPEKELTFNFSNPKLGKNIVAMDSDALNKRLCFVEHDLPGVVCVKLSPLQISTFTASGTHDFKGLAIDYYGKFLYYSDATTNTVTQTITDLVGANLKTYVDVGNPWALVFSVNDNALYWTDCSSTEPGIYRKAGDNINAPRVAIVTKNIVKPTAMAIDFVKGIIFWGDSGLNQLVRSKLDGTDVAVIEKNSVATTFHSLAIYKDNLFVSDSVNKLRIYNQISKEFLSLGYQKPPLSMTAILNTAPPRVTTKKPDLRPLNSEISHHCNLSLLVLALAGSLAGISFGYY